MLQNVKKKKDIMILSGGARGADNFGEIYARTHGYALMIYEAKWKEYGKAAGPMRNKKMAENADALIAFWDGKSKGTANMISEAEKHKIKVCVVRYDRRNTK